MEDLTFFGRRTSKPPMTNEPPRRGALEVDRRRDPAREADSFHPCRLGISNAVVAVLDHDTSARRKPELASGVLEEVRLRLASLDLKCGDRRTSPPGAERAVSYPGRFSVSDRVCKNDQRDGCQHVPGGVPLPEALRNAQRPTRTRQRPDCGADRKRGQGPADPATQSRLGAGAGEGEGHRDPRDADLGQITGAGSRPDDGHEGCGGKHPPPPGAGSVVQVGGCVSRHEGQRGQQRKVVGQVSPGRVWSMLNHRAKAHARDQHAIGDHRRRTLAIDCAVQSLAGRVAPRADQDCHARKHENQARDRRNRFREETLRRLLAARP